MLVYLVVALLLEAGLGIDEDVFVSMKNRVYIIGGDGTFGCHIERNTSTGMEMINGPEEIEWSFVPMGSNVSMVILNSDEQNRAEVPGSFLKYHREVWPDITIHNLTEADAGLYTCTLVRTGQAASAELYIIDTLPVCTKSNDGPVYYEGDNVTLTCTMGFHGNQKPNLDWTLPKIHVDYEHLKFEEKNRADMISASVTLQLQHMIDGKLFTCTAAFVNISTNSFKCKTLFKPQSVQYPPYISHMKTFPLTEEHNHEVNEGTNVTLACEGHANPQPQRVWKFFPKQSKTPTLLPCDMVTCTLTKVNTSNTGSYQCMLINQIKGENRSATQALYLKVRGSGYVPVTLPVTVEYKKEKKFSPYAIGAIVCASLAVILIIVFILLAMKMRVLHLLDSRMYIPAKRYNSRMYIPTKCNDDLTKSLV